jgi:hypothetical protein
VNSWKQSLLNGLVSKCINSGVRCDSATPAGVAAGTPLVGANKQASAETVNIAHTAYGCVITPASSKESSGALTA